MSVKVTQPFWLLLLIERITAARFDAHAEIVGSTTSGRALRLTISADTLRRTALSSEGCELLTYRTGEPSGQWHNLSDGEGPRRGGGR